MANSLTLRNGEFAILTGPNEGGKTELSLSIAESGWSAQVVGVAAASKFRFQPVPMLHITPEGDMKESSNHSRFRLEAEQMRTAVEQVVSTRCPVLLFGDELFSSTNEGEAATEAFKLFALMAALKVRPTIFAASHNRRLAHLLQGANMTTSYQLAWKDGTPTYKLGGGIAESSRAGETVKRAGLDSANLERLLAGGDGVAAAGDLSRFRELVAHLDKQTSQNRVAVK